MAGLPALAPASPVATDAQAPVGRPFPRCRLVTDAFELQGQVGKGQFGAVFKGRCRTSGETVALKKVLMKLEQEGFPLTALREIKLMSQLVHPNVLGLKEVVHSQATEGNRLLGDIYLVFDYMDYDLGGLLNKGIEFTLREIKCLSQQLLQGLFHLKVKNVLHRDLKVANLLLNRNGVLRIADFGLARFTKDPKKAEGKDKPSKEMAYTGTVCTRWYRPPELLLGERCYSFPVDMWSAGCIIAELFTGYPILQGGVRDAQTERDNDIDQFVEICKLLGSPAAWAGHEKLRHAPVVLPKLTFPDRKSELLTKMFKRHYSPQSIDLVAKILAWDPSKRLTAKEALDHDVFWKEQPLPCKPAEIRKFESGVHDSTTRAVAKRNLRQPKTREEAKAQAKLYAQPGPLSRHKPHAPPPPRRGPQAPSTAGGAPPPPSRRVPQAPSSSSNRHRPAADRRPPPPPAAGGKRPADSRHGHGHGHGRPSGHGNSGSTGARPPPRPDGTRQDAVRHGHGSNGSRTNSSGGHPPAAKRPKPP
eukprot:m.138271 g.138271  ORF g.138271 m.138271 type:complete len:531 (+) comp16067_c0_seq3:196-1788(+)